MSLEQTLTKLLTFNNINSLLVCEASLTELRAAVIEKKKDKLVVSPEIMHSDAPDFVAAITEIARKAKLKGWKGKHAILLTPSVVTSPLMLRIPHKHKVPLLQFEEAVRWEIDPIMQQQKQTLLLGQVLVANRSITPEQLTKLLDEQIGFDRSKNREVVYKRIAELAIERGHLTPNRLETAVARQHWFTDEQDDIKCDWHTLKISADLEPGNFPWLTAGINKAVLRKWQAAFAQQSIKLEACYPLVGTALGSAELAPKTTKEKGKSGNEVVLESHSHSVGVALLVNGELSQLITAPCHADNRLLQISDLYHRLGDTTWQRARLLDTASKSEQDSTVLSEDITELINLPVELINQPNRSCGLSMLGAASHCMGMPRARNVQGVSVHNPLPPLMQRFEVRTILTLVGFILLLTLIELGMMGKQLWIDYQNHIIKDDLAKVHAAQKEIQDNINRIKALETEMEGVELKSNALKNIQLLYGEKLPQQNENLQAFLKVFETTVDENVVFDKVTENGIRGFSINAWALDEISAQNFIKRFQLALNPLGYRLKDITVSQQTGRLGMIGNGIAFNATQLDDEKWEASKSLPVTATIRRR
ncbi:MAG: hypothetical protein Q8M99_01890 [Methylotenera sp.]|nr:hypothetical protein [Methylotenera sp.]